MNIGTTYLYKDGVRSEIPLNVNLNNNIVIEEKKMLEKSNYNTYFEDVYRKYIDSKYSLIRYVEGVKLSPINDDFIISVAINKDIDKESSEKLKNDINILSSLANYKIYIYNDRGDDFDVVYTTSAEVENIVSLFLREKNNNLSREDQENLQKFRIFNLERAFKDFNVPAIKKRGHYLINPNNKFFGLFEREWETSSFPNIEGGSILITSDETYSSMNNKGTDIRNLEYIYRKKYPDLNFKKLSLFELLAETGDIFIQILNYYAIVWTDEIINLYQKDKILEFLSYAEIIDNDQHSKDKIIINNTLNANDYTINDFKRTIDSIDISDSIDAKCLKKI